MKRAERTQAGRNLFLPAKFYYIEEQWPASNLHRTFAPIKRGRRKSGALVELLGLAVELRDLPRKDFKARLKNELEREISMSIATRKGVASDRRAEDD